jgi:hypothetical protein
MPTPSSGTISIQQINAEFGRGNNLNAYRGTTWFTPAGGSGTFPSGAIAMNDFYDKQPNSPTFSFTISSNQTNANLRTLAVNAGWNQSSKVVATISGGVVISSNSTGTPALTINGSFPGTVDLINNGTIAGMGGAGGYGANTFNFNDGKLQNGQAGFSGGLALSVSTAVSITNGSGTIAGGGGGGGGGANYDSKFYGTAGGGSGGGGRSSNTNSAGGPATVGGPGTNPASWIYPGGGAGNAGTFSSAGTGGAGGVYSGRPAGSGGTGGGWGSSGATGNAPPPPPTVFFTAGAGGGGGGAVSGNSNISWVSFGTRLGAIS